MTSKTPLTVLAIKMQGTIVANNSSSNSNDS